MKKRYFILASCLIALAGCTNDKLEGTSFEEVQKSFNSIHITVEENASTRAHLTDGVHFTWDKYDEIKVFSDEEEPRAFVKEDGLDGDTFIQEDWNGSISGNVFYAFGRSNYEVVNGYGYDPYEYDSEQPTLLRYYLLGDIVYDENGYALNHLPLVGKSTDNHFVMKHAVGMFKFNVDGNLHVKRITVMGNNGEVLCGKGTIDVTADEPVMVMDDLEDKSNLQLTLSYVDKYGYEDDQEFSLEEESPREFYFPVPVQDFEKGITLKIEGYNADGVWAVMYKKTDAAFSSKRGVIIDFESLNVNDEIAAVERLVSLAEEDAFIDNGYSTIWEVHTTGENMIDKMETVAAALKAMAKDDKRQITLVMPEAFAVPTRMFSNTSYEDMSHLYGFIGENVESVGNSAFEMSNYYGNNLTFVSLPKVKTIDDRAFSYSKLKTIDFPMVTEIGNGAFSSCRDLASINLPSVKTLHGYSFLYCQSLKSVVLPLLQTIKGSYIFEYCSELETVDLPELSDIDDEFESCMGMFYYCESLKNVNLPKLPIVTQEMFTHCTSLATISLPAVLSIGSYGFNGCTSLESVDLISAKTSDNNAFEGCSNLKEVNLPQLEKIASGLFEDCGNLISIDLPHVKKVEYDAFKGCGVRNMTLPNAETIWYRAFYGSKLTKLELPMVTSLGASLFDENFSLQSLTIGGGEGWSGSINIDPDAFAISNGYLGQCTLYLKDLALWDEEAGDDRPTYATAGVTGSTWTFKINTDYDWEEDSRSVDLSNFGHIYVDGTQIK